MKRHCQKGMKVSTVSSHRRVMEMIFQLEKEKKADCWMQSSGHLFSHDTAVDNRLKCVLLIYNFPGCFGYCPRTFQTIDVRLFFVIQRRASELFQFHYSSRCGLLTFGYFCLFFFFTFSSGNDPKREKKKVGARRALYKLFRFLISCT